MMNRRSSFVIRDSLLVVGSALLLIFSFPGFNMWFCAWFAFIPLFFALENQKPLNAFLISYLAGFIFFLGTIYWLIHVTLPGMLVAAAYLALYFGIFGLVSNRLTSSLRGSEATEAISLKARLLRPFGPRNDEFFELLFFIPAAWVALEWIRSHALTGFGWALLGYSQSSNLPIIQIADVSGTYGVSFLIVMFNAAVFFTMKNFRNRKEFLIPVFMTAVLMIAVLGYGLLRLNSVFAGEKLKVSVVQGNIPQDQKWDESFAVSIIKKYETLTMSCALEKPDLIIWPETSVPGFIDPSTSLRVNPEQRRGIENQKNLLEWAKGLAADANAPLLVGAPRYEEVNGRQFYYNSAFLILKDGSPARHYDKMHLVPFGEYVPFQNFFFFVHRFAPRPIGDFVGGKEFTVLRFPLERSVKEKDHNWKLTKRVGFGCLICFEDIFPDLARGLVKNNAGFLVNMTNDAWFGRSSAAYQHAQASVFRAVENRVNVVRVANTGLSCFIDQKGRIVSKVSKKGRDLFIDGFNTQEIILSRTRTIYTAYGDIFAYLCILFTIFCIIKIVKGITEKSSLRGAKRRSNLFLRLLRALRALAMTARKY